MPAPDLQPPFTISVDTGGTFTDLILADSQRVLGLYKSSSTPDDLFVGISAAIELAAGANGMTLGELLEQTKVFVYSTTRSTNAVLEGKVAKTAFLTTAGFRDVLLYREGGKAEPYNLASAYPEPYIPRRYTFELKERVLSDGEIVVPLDEDEVRGVLRRLRELEVEAVAVSLTFSIVNPAHEKRIGELIAEELPGVAFSLSHEVNGVVREYRRASATAIDASIKPLMRDHLHSLERRFRELGFAGEPLMVTHVSGGVMSLEEMAERPIQTIDSGPALAPVAGIAYSGFEEAAVGRQVIVVDTGGTSYDVSLVRDGNILYTREKWLGDEWTGHMTGLPAVDTRSLGAGGGSIAYIDEGGLLQVGPISAGAQPGPACYGRGGARPTVTDAALVLGYLDPENFLGGRMTLDLPAAREAFRSEVAEALGMSIEEAAEAVLRIASESMRGFTTDMTVSQGIDVRNCVIVAGGGAAGMNIVRIARDLGVREILVPRLASGLSAVGGQCTDISMTVSAGRYLATKQFDHELAASTIDELDRELDAFLAEVDHEGERHKRYLAEARYDAQIWEIDVDLGERPDFRDPVALATLHDAFDTAHLEFFSVNQPGAPLEVVSWRAEGRVVRPKPNLAMALHDGEPPVPHTRPMRFGSTTYDGGVYRVENLPSGTVIEGPAVIEEPTTTIVLDPGATAVAHPTHYLITLDEA
ncbi:hydantoinase/oxoprolinase family protein [Demequina salsinemoris]|uniref:hydantoinase/oxoprolinase family protein n=1 Tax=Demequina salsinemoris TaxID=577470 RepID=UPI0007831653|nr:hydantoinase/oxoprolinase family protein [Demequina salsinemoris]